MPVSEAALYLVLLTMTLVASGLGLIIVFQAYRGYRRNDSERMLFLAVGLALITIAPFGLSLLFTLIAPGTGSEELLMSYALPISSRVLEIVGLALILYSLYRS